MHKCYLAIDSAGQTGCPVRMVQAVPGRPVNAQVKENIGEKIGVWV